jgi:wyosine [tRNA(Phe)-imidazoG37] synthetase (radical SAM superfamily)
MGTFLFDKIIFGPVKSRRLGVSLGINLLPLNRKMCNFNCIYCECGWSGEAASSGERLPSRSEVYEALDRKLNEMKEHEGIPDVITFAGNGEPTLHPEFTGIIDDSIVLRNKYFPSARIAVLSNATTIKSKEIKASLLRVDMNILKLDSALEETIRIHNQPAMHIDVETLINDLAGFGGNLIIQTLFLRGTFMGRTIDNTTPEELTSWLAALNKIKPREVMIYTISRDTPVGGNLYKVPDSELQKIALMVEESGIKTHVSG